MRTAARAQERSLRRSQELLGRAQAVIPGASQTLSKGPTQWLQGVSPAYLERARGAHVWDVDGNRYLDFPMALGPVILGHCHPAVDAAITAQLRSGITFTLPHPLELELAERIVALVPNVERVRFAKSGSDATSAAVRLARAQTGRERVIVTGYHGWHDWYIGVTDRNAGIPRGVAELTATFGYNDLASVVEAIDDQTACVILEPVTFEEPRDGFLTELRRVCDQVGALLIFDEMWTGFRLALGGAQERFAVRADLACFSKAIANGMPLSVVTGRRDVMALFDKQVFFFTTFGGEALSLAAAKATIGELRAHRVPEQLERQGDKLKAGYNALAAELGLDYTRCVGYGCRSLVVFDATAGDPLEMKSLAQQELIRRGVLWGGFHNVSFAHADADVEHTLGAWREALAVLRDAVAARDVRGRLRGEPVEPVFRRTTGFNLKPRVAAQGSRS
jgi:glutamate-1-semialdehyde 2,1-aminomutase